MNSRSRQLAHLALLVCVGSGWLGSGPALSGAGVTLITHGFNGNVTDWVIPMGDRIPQYQTFPGTNVSSYQISITQTSGVYYVTPTFLDGVSPLSSDSGEIVIALDWSTLSGFGGPSTTVIATQAAAALLSTNLIPDLGGRPLAELPLHLVGHSRGASVVAELARALGAQGLWVDHTTTLDPFPLGLNGDPPMQNCANVLFADNDWQTIDFPSGQSFPGAYNRFLTNLSGGYPTGSAHSDVHLWYHGTVDLRTPAMDNLAMITRAERTNWWTTTEAAGTNTGFRFSLIGGGDRLSSFEPAGPGTGHVSDGFNKVWDLGGGLAANRSALPANNGLWPNLIRLNLTGTNQVAIGQPFPLAFYHQFGSTTNVTADLRIYLDRDSNPYNGNETLLLETVLGGTGTNDVFYSTLNLAANPATTSPGTYRVFARLSDGVRTRYLYAPGKLVLTANLQPPVLTEAGVQNGMFQFTLSGSAGQRIVIEASTNLAQWLPIQTNTLTNATMAISDGASPAFGRRFYRAVVVP